MADLNELQASQSMKIIGTDVTATETNPVNASATGDLLCKDAVNTASVSGAISVSTTAVEAKVGASAQTNRKFLSITPTNGTIYMGSSNAVTTATGTPIFRNQTTMVSFSASVPVWLIAANATDVRIIEGS